MGSRVAATLALVLGCVGTAPAADAPAPERRAELEHLVRHDCGSCHGMRLTGGLGPALTAAALAAKPRAVLLHAVMEGRTGTPMAPWKRFLSAAEARWIVEQLASGAFDER